MLVIIKKFTLGINPADIQEIEQKLKELGVKTFGVKPFKTTLGQREFTTIFFECQSNPEQMDSLITYLMNEFKGVASIT